MPLYIRLVGVWPNHRDPLCFAIAKNPVVEVEVDDGIKCHRQALDEMECAIDTE